MGDPVNAPIPYTLYPSTTVRVVVAEDQALVRTGFRMILTADGIDVVGKAPPAPRRSTPSGEPAPTWS